MKDSYKKLLIVWLLLYGVFTILHIVNIFNGSLDKSILSVGTYSLHITSVILFAFVGNRGEDNICKIGIISVIVYFLISVLYNLSVIDLYSASTAIQNKICSIIYHTSSNIISICEYLALFSLIKNNEKVDKYKAIAIIGLSIFTIINLVNNIAPSTKSDVLSNIKSTIDYIAMLAKYIAIILCLTDSQYFSTVFVTDDPYEDEVATSVDNVVQPVQQIAQLAPVNPVPQVQAAPTAPVEAPTQPQQIVQQPQVEQPTTTTIDNEIPLAKTGPVVNNNVETAPEQSQITN